MDHADRTEPRYTMPSAVNEEELRKLSKNQLISYIMKNIAQVNEGEAKVRVEAPPVDFNKIKLPPKPGLGMAFGPQDYKPLKPACCPPGAPPAPPAPPPVPSMPGKATESAKKNTLPPEQIKGSKRIFVKCERCDKTFIIDLPRALVLSNPLEVVPVTIMHDEKHALTVYLDQNFESRRDYVSELYYLPKAEPEKKDE